MMERTWLFLLLRLLAIMFRVYPSAPIAFVTRSRVDCRTYPLLFITRETVMIPTPAAAATSLIVIDLLSRLLRRTAMPQGERFLVTLTW
jgi:hypothetical protein